MPVRVFDNQADDNEKAFRRGNTVPEGAVNIAFAKAPPVSPGNNVVIIDTSNATGGSKTSAVQKKVAFANSLGILEDIHGNQIWDDEYPIVSDIFRSDERVIAGDFRQDDILPYLHVSRYFHVDHVGLAFGDLEPYLEGRIKVVDSNGDDYIDANGEKLYKVYVVRSAQFAPNADSISAPYRVYVYLDFNPDMQELYLQYNKTELNKHGVMKHAQNQFREIINARPAYAYTPEESDVIDRGSENLKIYSTKPATIKEKILGIPQQNAPGWKVYVPRKAIPDPRVFQVFRWRLACEFIQPVTQDSIQRSKINPRMHVGVIVPPGGSYGSTRANYWFYQLEKSDYNIASMEFVNPLKVSSLDDGLNEGHEDDKKTANYWHVDIGAVTEDELRQFDFLIWAPNSNIDITQYLPKIRFFTETVGGTIAFETSSNYTITGLTGITTQTPLLSNMVVSSNSGVHLRMNTLRFHDETPATPDDTFSDFGMWNSWPPKVADIITSYGQTGQILKESANIAGWDITDSEEVNLSPYLDEIATNPNSRWQQIVADATYDWDTVLEAELVEVGGGAGDYKPTMVHKAYESGGGIFVSSACVFEDHVFTSEGKMLAKTLNQSQVLDFEKLKFSETLDRVINSTVSAVEMKLRLNTLMLASVFNPAANTKITQDPIFGLTNNASTQSITIYSDWLSDWVIRPDDGVLTDDEIDEFKFVLQPTTVDGQNPKWQKILSPSTAKQIIDAKIKELDPAGDNPSFNTLSGAQKRYFIATTNPMVQVPGTEMLSDDSILTAWTDAYSPRFVIPADIGPHKIRDEMIAGTGAHEGRRIYPPKPYELQSQVSYINSQTINDTIKVTFTIQGSYQETRVIPDTYETRKILIPGTKGRYVDRVLHWNPDETSILPLLGEKPLVRASQRLPWLHQGLAPVPIHIHTWSDANYHITKTNNWAWMGEVGRIQRGSSGAIVKKIQDFLNHCVFFGLMEGPAPKSDGVFGPKTQDAIIRFQRKRHAQYIDGIVDAETWSLIGYALLELAAIKTPGGTWLTDPAVQKDLRDWAYQTKRTMSLETISDSNTSGPPFYARQSWNVGGPSVITEGFQIGWAKELMQRIFNTTSGNFEVYRLDVMPYLIGNNTVELDWIDIRGPRYVAGTYLTNYNYTQGSPGKISRKVGKDGKWIVNHFGPIAREMDRDLNVVFRLKQSNPTGWGTTRILGVRDVCLYVKKYWPGTPDRYETETVFVPGRTYQIPRTFTAKATYTFKSGQPVVFTPFSTGLGKLLNITGEGPLSTGSISNISDLKWTSTVSFNKPSDLFEVDTYTKKYKSGANIQTIPVVEITYNGGELSTTDEYHILGPRFGRGQTAFYTKTPTGTIDPFDRTYGYITKQDGLKLICDADGNPWGFPATLPDQIAGSSKSAHFTSYTLAAFNTDQTVYYGFYDIVAKEFITNNYGWPEISFYDYIRRGPQNVFIAVQTTYELDFTSNLPNTGEPIDRPFKWIMPAYGVTTGQKAKIQIEPLPPSLTNKDVWPIPIKTGSFVKELAIRPRSQGSILGALSEHQGRNVIAYYEIPEAEHDAWSGLFGRPYRDIRGEMPQIVDDDIIKVRQAPILIAKEFTTEPSLSDPWRPVMTVFVRQTLNSEWRKLNPFDIADYNCWTGEIHLRQPLTSNDPRLIKVDYTSQRPVYHFRHDGTNKINLNPYINFKPEWRNIPLYVYIKPHYILDENHQLIADTFQDRTLNITTDPSIFGPDKVDYDPTALLLGIVYISTAMDLNELLLLDTRQRGGGLAAKYNPIEIAKINAEAMDYMDIEQTNGATAYQAGGFVIIRLPKELAAYYTEKEVKAVIERNITAGVRFQLQDLDGDPIDFLSEATP